MSARKPTRAEVEIWLPVPGYEGLYAASNLGRVKSLPKKHRPTERIVGQRVNERGYHSTSLVKDGKVTTIELHRVVALAFLGPKPSPTHQVRHLDGVKTNNHISNLCWGTHAENVQDSIRLREYVYGESVINAKLTAERVRKIKANPHRTAAELASEFGVRPSTIRDVRLGRRWRHVPAPEIFNSKES